MPSRPYKVTAVWDQDSLPLSIRKQHNTKAGIWGLLRVIEGEVDLVFVDGPTVHVTRDSPAVIPPQEMHHVEAHGPFRMQVEFYHEEPSSE